MASPAPHQVDIVQVYRRYCDIRSASKCLCIRGDREYDKSQEANFSRDALKCLLKLVDMWTLIFSELLKLMSQLDLMKNQRHNISEDTWQQVLAFSRCVYENLEGYDPKGAWPVLIDDFVEHISRVSLSNGNGNLFCGSGVLGPQSYTHDMRTLSLGIHVEGLRELKRKLPDFENDPMESSDTFSSDHADPNRMLSCKRSKLSVHRPINGEDSLPGTSAEYCSDFVRHSSPKSCSKSLCTGERCLSKVFAGLLSTHSYVQLDHERRVSYA